MKKWTSKMKEVTLKVLIISNKHITTLHSPLKSYGEYFSFQGTHMDNYYDYDINDNHRIYCAPAEYYFNTFGEEKIELHTRRLEILDDGGNLYYVQIQDHTTVSNENALFTVKHCYFIDKDCKIIDNKLDDHLKANVKFYHLILIDQCYFSANNLAEYVSILEYMKDYPNIRFTCKGFKDLACIDHNKNLTIEILSRETTDIYNNDHISKMPTIIPTLPSKLIDVLGLNETYSELAKLQLENERLNSRIEELESKLKSQSILEDEIAKMRGKLDVVKGLFS